MTQLAVTGLGSQADGIATRADGTPVFLKNAVPGDMLVLTAAGHVAEIIPGPNRQTPPCVHFGLCGGCQLQHVSASIYADWLNARILGTLAQLGITPAEIAPVHISPPYTRRRVSVKMLRDHDGLKLGFTAARQHTVVDLAMCTIMHPQLWQMLQKFKVAAGPLVQQGQAWTIAATLTGSGVDMSVQGLHPSGVKQQSKLVMLAETLDLARLTLETSTGMDMLSLRRPPSVRFAGVDIVLPPNSFLQATADGETALTAAVIASLGKSKKIADLFCGVGTFSLPLAQHASVLAADASKPAVDALAAAAQPRLKTLHQDLFRRPLRAEDLNSFDCVVFDPPRAGAAAQTSEICRSKVRRVIAVSCNPNTFARDAEQLVKAGFALEKLWPVGQFLWSTHVELVACFTR